VISSAADSIWVAFHSTFRDGVRKRWSTVCSWSE